MQIIIKNVSKQPIILQCRKNLLENALLAAPHQSDGGIPSHNIRKLIHELKHKRPQIDTAQLHGIDKVLPFLI